MFFSLCSSRLFTAAGNRRPKWPCRDIIRLWCWMLPFELLLLFMPSHGFHDLLTPLAAWGSIWMLFILLRRLWGYHRAHGMASLMLIVMPFSAFGYLPWLQWRLCFLPLALTSMFLYHRNIKMIFRLLLLATISTSVYADTTQTWSGKADITFDGTSTLHDWGGKVSAKPFITQAVLDDAGKPTRLSGEVTVEAAKMDTAEAKRDENMRKAMKVTDHPLISAKIDVPADKIAADGKTPTKLPMTLTLLGKPQQITGTISNWKLNGGKATFDLEFPVSMKASGISVPTVLLFIKVGDSIKVRASVTLTKN